MIEAYINNIEYFLPSNIESNQKILRKIGGDNKKNKKIIRKIGIENRRIADNNTFSNDLAIKSARKILKSFDAKSIDHLIYCTQTPDYLIPTNACIIQNRLNLKKNIGAFDINLGCSGYVYSLSIAKSLIVSGHAKNILLITADTYSKFIKKNDLSTRLIFSDSSTSTIISSKKNSNSFKILNFTYGTDGAGYKDFIVNNFGSRFRNNPKKNGEFIHMEGKNIFNFTLNEIPRAINEFLKKNHFDFKKISFFVFHQANEFIVKNLQKKLKIPDEKIIIDIKNVGNTVSGTIPIILSKNSKKIKRGQYVLLVGFGVGFSWGICLIKKILKDNRSPNF